MNRQVPQNTATRPNWYKMRLPPHLTTWATDCLQEAVDLKKYQGFQKVSISCKNNGRTIFMRLLFEGRLFTGGVPHGAEKDLIGLPVSYLIDVNKSTLQGNCMDYDIGNGIKYPDIYPVYNTTIDLDERTKFTSEKYRLFKFMDKFIIPKVHTKNGKCKKK